MQTKVIQYKRKFYTVKQDEAQSIIVRSATHNCRLITDEKKRAALIALWKSNQTTL